MQGKIYQMGPTIYTRTRWPLLLDKHHYAFVPSFGFLVVTGWEGPGLFVPATAAISFLVAASV